MVIARLLRYFYDKECPQRTLALAEGTLLYLRALNRIQEDIILIVVAIEGLAVEFAF